ncbi:axoneme-associated protein mst101(2)-like [Neocloeon triangulifer]|uniref:axoneme-associated protein mst101(2)-like n=1 Tax=Neocloeon triangulifer TaxID=2078957 RepID=UPI00286F2971|nr:axoneme-associated protein mst101(2)-like [Neocloeon triangulifer]
MPKCCVSPPSTLVAFNGPDHACRATRGALKAFNVFLLNKQQRFINSPTNSILFQSLKVKKALGRRACFVNCYLKQKGAMSATNVIDTAKLTSLLTTTQTDAAWKSKISTAITDCISIVEGLSIPDFVSQRSTCPGKAFVIAQCVVLKTISNCPTKVNTKICMRKYNFFNRCTCNIFKTQALNKQVGVAKQKKLKKVKVTYNKKGKDINGNELEIVEMSKDENKKKGKKAKKNKGGLDGQNGIKKAKKEKKVKVKTEKTKEKNIKKGKKDKEQLNENKKNGLKKVKKAKTAKEGLKREKGKKEKKVKKERGELKKKIEKKQNGPKYVKKEMKVKNEKSVVVAGEVEENNVKKEKLYGKVEKTAEKKLKRQETSKNSVKGLKADKQKENEIISNGKKGSKKESQRMGGIKVKKEKLGNNADATRINTENDIKLA